MPMLSLLHSSLPRHRCLSPCLVLPPPCHLGFLLQLLSSPISALHSLPPETDRPLLPCLVKGRGNPAAGIRAQKLP